MIYGDGDGVTFSSLTSLDVCGHELTHAVTDYSADLIYQGESGALNEAMSDVLGTAIEFYATPAKANWLIGEECYTPGTNGDALRYMNNPNLGNQPDTYLGTNWYSGSGDYGGVHTNSGVLNYAFYFMTVGGSGTNDFNTTFNVSGIGIEKTRVIAYRALTVYLTSSSNYAAARTAFLSAASDLYGLTSSEYKSVSDAFGAVGIGVKLIVKNSFDAGTIKVNTATVSSGYTYFATSGTSQTYEAIPQFYNPYDRVWNTSGNALSNWKKQPDGSQPSPIPNATNITYSFNASSSDHKATFIADLKMRYNIYRNDQTDFEGTQSNAQTFQIVEQNSGTVTAPLSKTVNNRNYLFYKWSDGVTTNQRTVANPTSNQTLTAQYKAHFLTDQNTGFETNGSHKFIRTGDGTLHLVYSSRYDYYYKIFYETSSDNEATWQLRYSGDGNGNPAIAAVNNSRVVFIYPTWNVSGNIVAVCYDLSTNSVLSTSSVLYQGGVDSPTDVNIAITSNGKILVTWYNDYFDPEYYFLMGYYARYGTINSSGIMSWLSDYNYEGGALASSTASHAAIDVRIHDGDGLFHFAFEDDDAYGRRQIYYCPLIYSGGVVHWYVYSPYNNCLSSSSGFENNTNPSFIAINGSEATRFNWLGEFDGDVMSVFKDPGYYRYWTFGSSVTSTSINKASDGYVIGWSNGYDHSYTNNGTLYELGSISSIGRYIQIGDADVRMNMKAMGFNTASSPYVFNLSSPIGSMQKADAQANQVAYGRSGVISIQAQNTDGIKRDSTKIKKATSSFIQFAFTIDNVTVDGQPVKIINIPETVKPTDAATLNNYLTTEPFAVNGNTSLTYDVAFATTHSDKAAEVLKQNRFVNFKVELIDAKTQQVIGVLNNSNNSENQITKRQTNFLDIDCRGIKSSEVQLRLVVATNADAQFAVTDKVVRLADVLRKGNVERTKISYQGSTVVTDYALEQNYPNPFNPSTTINYQIPNPGNVSLKVFDMLGREVAQLVNEYKQMGRYAVTFDGSQLSSGSYIVRMQSEKYTKTMKVMLVK